MILVRGGGQIAILGPEADDGAYAEQARAPASGSRLRDGWLQRGNGTPDRRWQRLLPDAVTLRTLWADPDAGAALRVAADCTCDRGACGHNRRRRDRFSIFAVLS